MSELAISTKDTKAVLVRFNEAMREFWRTGNVTLFDGILAPDYVQHWPGFPTDREGYLQRLQEFRLAFPDLKKTIEDVLTDADKVMDRVSVRATHTGELLGYAPTGKRIEITEMHVARVANGLIVERWGEWDLLGLLRQIGAVSQRIEI